MMAKSEMGFALAAVVVVVNGVGADMKIFTAIISHLVEVASSAMAFVMMMKTRTVVVIVAAADGAGAGMTSAFVIIHQPSRERADTVMLEIMFVPMVDVAVNGVGVEKNRFIAVPQKRADMVSSVTGFVPMANAAVNGVGVEKNRFIVGPQKRADMVSLVTGFVPMANAAVNGVGVERKTYIAITQTVLAIYNPQMVRVPPVYGLAPPQQVVTAPLRLLLVFTNTALRVVTVPQLLQSMPASLKQVTAPAPIHTMVRKNFCGKEREIALIDSTAIVY